ncbi:MAG: copper homeostasis protein CutC [Planctomycetota bacterium]|nr:MAG: copper homeostasis protein CutC [Planctomycetota bacterium]
MTRITLEIAVESAKDAVAAAGSGADRVELSADLACGGVTPAIETIRQARTGLDIPLLVLIRPRPGEFVYSGDELERMRDDLRTAVDGGADGLVFGALTHRGRLDAKVLAACVEACGSRVPVLHRAFDESADPFEALETAISLGFRRILTSGRRACAAEPEAAALLRELIERAAGRIEILPGGGVRPHNVRAVLAGSGCDQVHSACRVGLPGNTSTFDADLVTQLRGEVDAHASGR